MGPADFHLFTDGAADGGTERGGGGVVVFDGGGEVERLSLPAGRYCSSFTVEAAAMLAAVRWLGEREGWTTAALITDIMSLLQALQGRGGGCRVENIRRELWDLYGNGKQVGLAWVPGHCGLPGNEAADEMARRGSELAQERVGVDLATRMAVARRGTRRSAQLTHHRLKEVYAGGLRCGGGRAHEGREVMLVRFRTGHHPVLRRWQAMVDESWWMNGG